MKRTIISIVITLLFIIPSAAFTVVGDTFESEKTEKKVKKNVKNY